MRIQVLMNGRAQSGYGLEPVWKMSIHCATQLAMLMHWTQWITMPSSGLCQTWQKKSCWTYCLCLRKMFCWPVKVRSFTPSFKEKICWNCNLHIQNDCCFHFTDLVSQHYQSCLQFMHCGIPIIPEYFVVKQASEIAIALCYPFPKEPEENH